MPGAPATELPTWKEWSGRESGSDAYHFGDITRFLWRKLTGHGGEARRSNQAASIDDADLALLDLKVQRDQLVGHRRRAERLFARDEEAAWTLTQAKKKEQAMLALRKKKLHQQMVLECEAHIAKLEELIDSIELARVQQDVVAALAEGVKTLRKVQQETGGVDYINQLLDERQEAIEAQQEMNEALASMGVGADDADALAELARLEEAMAAEATATAVAKAAAATPAEMAQTVTGTCTGTAAPASAAPASAPEPAGAAPLIAARAKQQALAPVPG